MLQVRFGQISCYNAIRMAGTGHMREAVCIFVIDELDSQCSIGFVVLEFV